MMKCKPIGNREKAIANKEYRKQDTGQENGGGWRGTLTTHFSLLTTIWDLVWNFHYVLSSCGKQNVFNFTLLFYSLRFAFLLYYKQRR